MFASLRRGVALGLGQRGLSTSSQIPVYSSVATIREWRNKARDNGKSVGFVATMGALHAGHLSLVQHSMQANDTTVVSIFVNPAQFAPHEDLDKYPRVMSSDIEKLASLSEHGAPVVFAPSVAEMYPNGICQDVNLQKGAFVEVKWFGQQLEGRSRPSFFCGVATVVAKLFNAVQPDHTYFGQKDLQQALLLRRMCSDLLISHPEPQNLHIVPTSRDPSGLALSSRNSYLTPLQLRHAKGLNSALRAGEAAWNRALYTNDILNTARRSLEESRVLAKQDGVDIRPDYIELNFADSLESVPHGWKGQAQPMILSGAMWVGQTRLIDNLILGDASRIIN